METYKGWNFHFNPKPIPTTEFDVDIWREGEEESGCFHARNKEEAKQVIDELED
jgi:hypothetical protein